MTKLSLYEETKHAFIVMDDGYVTSRIDVDFCNLSYHPCCDVYSRQYVCWVCGKEAVVHEGTTSMGYLQKYSGVPKDINFSGMIIYEVTSNGDGV